MAEKTSHLVVMITCGSQEEAEKIGKGLVEEKLAACVNVVPQIQSIYRWQGKVCQENEILLLCKTSSTVFSSLEKRVKELHSYDVPEIIGLGIEKGSESYLGWLWQNVS